MPRTRRQRNGAGVSSNGDDAFVANLILKPVEKMNLYEMRSLLKIMKRGGKGLAQVRRAELERRVKRLIASMKSSKGAAKRGRGFVSPNTKRINRRKARSVMKRKRRSVRDEKEEEEEDDSSSSSSESEEDSVAPRTPKRSRTKASPSVQSTGPRRRKNPWTVEEVEDLRKGYQKYSSGKQIAWKKMLEDDSLSFDERRTSGDLKDKWRNLHRVSLPIKLRKDRVPWTDSERDAVQRGYERYKDTKQIWSNILKDPDLKRYLHGCRSNVDLKDCYRRL
eukprot:g1720.t1